MAISGTPSFIDNPLVGAIGNALGMSGLLGDSKSAMSATQLKPPPVPDNETEKIRDSRNIRQSYPKAAVSRGLQPGGGGISNPAMNLPGVMSPDVLMHPEVQKLLGQYGVSPEQLQQTVAGASPNLFVTNPDAYARHPMLATMAERGLEGLAFTQGGRTVGESLSNVAQGLLNARAARADKYNNQLMMPFAQAAQVAQMKGLSQEEALKQAQIKYDQAHADYFDQLPEIRQAMLDQQTKFHNATIDVRKQALNERMMTDKRLSYLTPDQSQQLQDEMGGDDFDISRFEHYAQMGQQNYDEAQARLKKEVAHIGASGRVDNTASNHQNTDYEGTWKAARQDRETAEKNLLTWDKQLTANPMAIGEDGKFMSTSQKAARRQDLVNKIAAAQQREAQTKADYDKFTRGMSVPGSGMVQPQAQPQKHIPTYNVVTGKIE